jgi:hypothetical protein
MSGAELSYWKRHLRVPPEREYVDAWHSPERSSQNGEQLPDDLVRRTSERVPALYAKSGTSMCPPRSGSSRTPYDAVARSDGEASLGNLTWLRSDADREPIEMIRPLKTDAYVIDVAGVRAVYGGYLRLHEQGRDLVVACTPGSAVARTLRLTAADRQLEIEPSRASAVAHLHGTTPSP